MSSMCPKCHGEVEEDAICCADVRHTFKCVDCGKLTTAFTAPYGKCFLCGGVVTRVTPYDHLDPSATRLIEEAVRFELEMFQFYRLARHRAPTEKQRAVFEQLYLKEMDHLSEIEAKYHVHLPQDAILVPPRSEVHLTKWLFDGIDMGAADSVRPLYEKAITMERRTRDFFAARARDLAEGMEQTICRELAAEEEEHVFVLEGELSLLESHGTAGGSGSGRRS